MATGWGNKTWGASEWGDLSNELVVVSSVAAQTSVNSVITEANANVFPTTLSATFTLQGAVAGASADVFPTGIAFNIVTGNEGIGIGVPVTGSSASTNITGVTIDDQFLIGSGWGRETWGSFVWGDAYSVQLQGISLSIVTGNEDAFTDITVAVSGQQLQTAITPVGTSANSDHEIAASLLISSAQGDTTIEGTALVQPTGISASVNIGDAEAGLLLEVPVTGVSANINIGNEDTSGNANVFPSSVSATFTLGNVTAVSVYSVTGVSASFNIGQVTTVGSATVIPTGISLTTAIGSPRITAWAEVNTGTQVTWTEVDLAA